MYSIFLLLITEGLVPLWNPAVLVKEDVTFCGNWRYLIHTSAAELTFSWMTSLSLLLWDWWQCGGNAWRMVLEWHDSNQHPRNYLSGIMHVDYLCAAIMEKKGVVNMAPLSYWICAKKKIQADWSWIKKSSLKWWWWGGEACAFFLLLEGAKTVDLLFILCTLGWYSYANIVCAGSLWYLTAFF